MRKKVDDRIRSLIENGVNTRHRSLFVVIGDNGCDQVVNLHYLLSRAAVKARPTVLWCYEEKLEISSHKIKRAKQVERLMQKGLLDPEKVDPFLLFSESGGLSYCRYRDTERILGSTYGMCVLQDFEALTPNILARTIETVEGGGLVVVMLLNTPSSLTKLCTMVMDVHKRYRTKVHCEILSRFNERFLLSLASCKSCLVMDDDLNILPISSSAKSLASASVNEGCCPRLGIKQQLINPKQHDAFPIGPLVSLCSTLDQGKVVSVLLNTILSKARDSIVALVAPRGRGKSAALGIAIVGAIASGYSNIFVTAPTPENLKSLFEFICRALNALQYEEHLHYNLVRSSSLESQKTIIKVNIYKQHRQTIQYIHPNEHPKLTQAELLVIDEAAAISLPVIHSLLGPYLVFLSSTVNGYEGTGRSLSLKLLTHLEKKSQITDCSDSASLTGRQFSTLKLKEPIRYAFGDPLENWLNNLLCLDGSIAPIFRYPLPSECNLYYVNRDTLFSFRKESEIFLQRMMALYVASHDKNSPDDLQLMADSPNHHLFVLLGPVDGSQNVLPDILCVIQVCLERHISSDYVWNSLQMDCLQRGDQISWKFCEVFRDTEFSSLSGARVVRIAVHPGVLREGYGSAALKLLTRYYKGHLTFLRGMELDDISNSDERTFEYAKEVSIQEETTVPKEKLPPLLVPACERLPEKNSVTGEHSCMVLKPLDNEQTESGQPLSVGVLNEFYKRFRSKFIRDIPHFFRDLDYNLVLSILCPKIGFSYYESTVSRKTETSKSLIDLADFNELEAYIYDDIDYKEVFHIATTLAQNHFNGKRVVTLSDIEASILLSIGLQLKDISSVEDSMKLESSQIKAKFHELMQKFHEYFKEELRTETIPSFLRSRETSMEYVNEDWQEYSNRNRQSEDENDDWQEYSNRNRESEFAESLQSPQYSSSCDIVSVKSQSNSNSINNYKRKRKDTSNSINSSKRKGKHL